MNVLIDASALAKLVLFEEDWDRSFGIWDAAQLIFASRLVYPEVRAALSRARRTGRLAAPDYRFAREDLERRWAKVHVVELDAVLADAAGDVADLFGLRAADSIHLASALRLADPELSVATWDRELATAATEAGLAVVPAPQLPDG